MVKNFDVHIWYRNTKGLDSTVAEMAERHLSIEERRRRDQLSLEADRRDFTIAHDLLRRALSRYSDVPPDKWRFATNDYGRPLIESTDPHLNAISFSLSHTRGFAACGITRGTPLGIDIEPIDQSQLSQLVADRFFSEKEASWLRQCPDESRSIRFTELWTLKEAFLKAMGVGLSGSLACGSFHLDDDNRVEFSAPPDFEMRGWHFALFEPVRNVRLGVAVCSARPRFLVRDDQVNGRKLTPIFISTQDILI
jgi:phosphopantetheinyl transferase